MPQRAELRWIVPVPEVLGEEGLAGLQDEIAERLGGRGDPVDGLVAGAGSVTFRGAVCVLQSVRVK